MYTYPFIIKNKNLSTEFKVSKKYYLKKNKSPKYHKLKINVNLNIYRSQYYINKLLFNIK